MSDQIDLQPQTSGVPMAKPVFNPPPPPVPVDSLGDDQTMRMLLPVGRSGWAIAAGYLGLFCLAVVPGPFALIVSLIACHDLRKHREKRGWGRAIFGLIMGLLATAILAIYAVAWFHDKFGAVN